MIGGIILYFFDVPVIDPLLSVGITLYVLYNVVRNLRQSMKIMLQATPPHINPKEVEKELVQLPGIRSIHDLHIWTLDGTYNVLTLHAVVAPDLLGHQAEALKKQVRERMADIDIQHVTVELEATDEHCGQEECI